MGKITTLVLFFNSLCFAGDNLTKLHGFQMLYTGEQYKTFTDKNPGVGAEMIISTEKDHFNYFSKGRLTTISGSQKFSDNGTGVTSAFKYYQTSFEFGANLYPLGQKKRDLNLYVGASGILSYNYIALTSTSFTQIKPSYQGLSFGYAADMGVEWYLADRWCLSMEFAQRFETVQIAEQSQFNLGGLSMAVGLGW